MSDGHSPSLLARYGNEAVGAFMLLALAVFIVALLETGRVREWFNPGETFKVILPQSGLFGLSEGAIVEIIGTNAGEVRRIVIDPDQQMHAEVYVRQAMLDFIRRDSEAIIRKRFGVAGDAYLDISRGFGEPMDWEFAVMTARADLAPTETMTQVVEEVRTKILPLIDEAGGAVRALAGFAQRLGDPSGDVQQTLANIEQLTGRIKSGQGAVGRLLNDTTMVKQLESLLGQVNTRVSQLEPVFGELRGAVGDVSAISQNLAGQLPALVGQLQSTLAELENLLADLGKPTPELPRLTQGAADSLDSMPVLLIQTQESLSELEKLLRQLRQSWLLGGGDTAPGSGTRLSPLEVKP